MPGRDLIDDGAGLWRELVSAAGLRPETYDQDLVAAVRETLGMGGPGTVDDALAGAGVTAASVLDAVLLALQPFALMLSDLLALYEHVGATCAAGENLRIAYKFSGREKKLSFDLASFREVARRWVDVTVPVLSTTVAQLWSLDAALRPDRTIAGNSAAAQPLYAAYRDGGRWPAKLPSPPPTDSAPLDEALTSVFDLAGRVLDLSREDVASLGLQAARSRPGTLWELHADLWLAGVVDHAYQLAEAVRTGAADPVVVTAGIHAVLDALTTEDQRHRRRVEELLDVLALPVWGKRHELYSAWLLTQILAALGRDRVSVHVADGTLAFSFAGTHVASVDSAFGRLELWAELRHPYATPVGRGRRRGIQPDYTLAQPPITQDSSAVLVVEAKQYRTGKKSNFLDALVDYAGGHPRATVVLANYGTVPASVPAGAPPTAVALGNVRPDERAACRTFQDEIRAAVPRPARRATAIPVLVVLKWRHGEDLDLCLVRERTGTVTDYSSIPGQHDDEVVLVNDDRSAPGREEARIGDGAGPVSVWVHRFSGKLPFAESCAHVEVRSRARTSTTITRPPDEGDATSDWWLVGVVEETGTWTAVNELSAAGPGHVG